MKNYKKWTLVLLAVLLTGAVAAGGIWWNKNRPSSDSKNNPQVSDNSEPRLVVQRVTNANNGAFSKDGKLFAISNCELGELTVFDVSSGKEIRRFNNFTNYYSGNGDCANLIGFSFDGKTVAYIASEYNKSEQVDFDYIWLFNVVIGEKTKKQLPAFSGLTESEKHEREFKKNIQSRIYVRTSDGGIAYRHISSGGSIEDEIESLRITFPGAEPLSETERQAEIKKEIDKDDKMLKYNKLMRFYGLSDDSLSNISISDNLNFLDLINKNGTETLDLKTGKKTSSTNAKVSIKSKFSGTDSNQEIAKSNDGKLVAVSESKGIQIKSIESEKLKIVQSLNVDTAIIPQSYFTGTGFYTLTKTSNTNNQILLRDESKGDNKISFNADFLKYMPSRLADTPREIVADISDDGKRLASLFNNEVNVFEVVSGKKIISIRLADLGDSDDWRNVKRVKISPKGTFVAVNHTGQILETATGREVYNKGGAFSSINFSEDEKFIVLSNVKASYGTPSNSLVETENWNESGFAITTNKSNIWTLTFDKLEIENAQTEQSEEISDCQTTFNHANFSPNRKLFAIASSNQCEPDVRPFLIIWDKSENKLVRSFEPDSIVSPRSAFSPDGRFMAISDETKIKLHETVSGKEIKSFIGHSDIILRLQFSLDGKLLLSESQDNTSKIWRVEDGKEVIQMVKFQNGDWIVTTPDGRFDTNNLDKVEGMHWIMASEPLRPLPIEIFMRQYYEPRLLARVLRCNEEKNCEREFKPLPALNTLNRTQPTVKIGEIKPDSEGTVEVTVEVANAKSEGQKDTFGNPLESGVYDVRLFRDGQLVGYAPKNVSDKLTTWEWIKSWFVEIPKGSNAVELDKDGKATLKFSKIKLPKTGIDKLEFSAYAFNSDQIKSETSRQIYQFKPNTVKGRAYVVSVGVNYTDKPKSNLRFAANDARQTQENLGKRLREQGQYEEVINIPLISDFTANSIPAREVTFDQSQSGQITVTENTATKAHFKAVLDVLAGRTGDAELLKTIQNADKLRQANPEDLIIISVSSHGNADSNGIFYLLASDAKTISSDELSLWLRDVDGGEIALIIDACRSASAVESADFKPAPMNSRGLGQLSYDKGMRILTATQADNVALETNKTRQGLLSYALLQNGLNDFQADFKPQDNSIVMSEWLNFGVQRVPRLYEEASSGQVKVVRETNDTAETQNQQREEKTQQPSLFDFSRKNRDATLEKRAGSIQSKVVETPQEVKPISAPTPVSTPKPIPEGFNGRVIKEPFIVRVSDSHKSAELGKVLLNDSIKIGLQKGGWFRVTTISGVEGWMHGDSLEFVK